MGVVASSRTVFNVLFLFLFFFEWLFNFYFSFNLLFFSFFPLYLFFHSFDFPLLCLFSFSPAASFSLLFWMVNPPIGYAWHGQIAGSKSVFQGIRRRVTEHLEESLQIKKDTPNRRGALEDPETSVHEESVSLILSSLYQFISLSAPLPPSIFHLPHSSIFRFPPLLPALFGSQVKESPPQKNPYCNKWRTDRPVVARVRQPSKRILEHR